jgi:soluble cytochrome b562
LTIFRSIFPLPVLEKHAKESATPMKHFPHKITAIATAILLGMNFAAATARADEPKTELSEKMKVMGKSLKQLKSQLADPAKQQSTVELLETAKQAATDAKKFTPLKAKEVPEANRPKFISDYQAEMDKLIDQLGKTEDAVKAGKYDDASKLFGELGPIKREGHKEFHAEEK